MGTIKSFFTTHRREVMLCAVMFFVATLCFGLGYEADREFNGMPIIIEKCAGIPAGAVIASSTDVKAL